jgi:hypothetical protein
MITELISSRSNLAEDDIAVWLAFELAVGLAVGLAFGLAFELAVGLAGGLAGVLTQLASSSTSLEWIAILAAILVITEVLFLFWIFDKSKPDRGESKMG